MSEHAHSHDGIDWNAHLERLRAGDELVAPETARLAKNLLRPQDRVVADVGAGAGGAAAAFAEALSPTGGTVVLVDSATELLSEAAARVWESAGSAVDIRSVLADATDEDALAEVGQADVVFASFVVHHFPDQLAGLRRLRNLVRPGGRLAIVESGLRQQVLPWDVGVGEPGLEARLHRAREDWFGEMRAEMPGSVRLPVGWSQALSEAGLAEAHSWNYVVDRPAPATGPVLDAVVRHLEWLQGAAQERSAPEDVEALDQLLDPDGPNYVGHRGDVHLLAAHGVHVGTRPDES